jgi:hypothetical protein
MTKEALDKKIPELQKEILEFAQKADQDIAQARQALINLQRQAQQAVDRMQGRLMAYQDMRAEFEPKDSKPNDKPKTGQKAKKPQGLPGDRPSPRVG